MAWSRVSTAEDRVWITSLCWDFGVGFGGSNKEEKASVETLGGTTWDTEMGRCWEKNDATWTSAWVALFSWRSR